MSDFNKSKIPQLLRSASLVPIPIAKTIMILMFHKGIHSKNEALYFPYFDFQ